MLESKFQLTDFFITLLIFLNHLVLVAEAIKSVDFETPLLLFLTIRQVRLNNEN